MLFKQKKKFNLEIFLNNIASLNIRIDINKFPKPVQILQQYNNGSLGGFYWIKKNTIYLWHLYNVILNHELFHVATTPMIDNKNIIITGFEQVYKKASIGSALNEGYTNLITKRYFKKEIQNCPNAYSFETNVAAIIENIVGEDKMMNYYSKASLSSLVKELVKYAVEPEIIDFLHLFDRESRNYYSFSNGHNIFNKQAKDFHDFLFKIYAKKLHCDLLEQKITEEQYITYIAQYLHMFHLDLLNKNMKETLSFVFSRKEMSLILKKMNNYQTR